MLIFSCDQNRFMLQVYFGESSVLMHFHSSVVEQLLKRYMVIGPNVTCLAYQENVRMFCVMATLF